MPRSKPETEALERLRERLEATQAAAGRLAAEAAAERDRARDAADRPPAAGWDVPRRAEEAGDEIDALLSLLGTLRDVLPPELRVQLAELARALLVFVRAIVEWAIERMEIEAGAAPRPGAGSGVEDIPIA